MAQVKIYGLKANLAMNKLAISHLIHGAIITKLKIPKNKCFQRFFALESVDFIYPEPRSENYLIIEITLMKGRSSETRKALIKELFVKFEEILNIQNQDIEIILHEVAPENFGFRGVTGDEANLDYPLNV